MKLGSLFDGIGGFPFVASMYGITPVWASEIEDVPISITKRHFPNMQHLGDITKIDGAIIPPVDIITFGSPCQDLSVAGKQKGIQHVSTGNTETTRSGLFHEAIRIIKEMRSSSNGKYPTFVVWENVPGAFSSNKGEDFATVLQELVSIEDSSANVPRPPLRKGKNKGLDWSDAGFVRGDKYSLAWRVLDAQFMGVPQRRRRIYAVLALDDSSSCCAAKVLFKQESQRRYLTPCSAPWKSFARFAHESTGSITDNCLTPWDAQSNRVYDPNGVYPTMQAREKSGMDRTTVVCPEKSFMAFAQNQRDEVRDLKDCAGALAAQQGVKQQTYLAFHNPATVYAFDSLSSNSMKSSNPFSGVHETEIAKTLDTTYPDPSKNQGGIAVVQPQIYDARGNGDGRVSCTLTGDHQNRVTDYTAIVCVPSPKILLDDQGGSQITVRTDDVAPTLRAETHGNLPCVLQPPTYCLQGNGIDRADTAGCNGKGWTEDVSYTLNTVDRPAVAVSVATYQQVVGALCQDDYKGINSQYVTQDKLIVDNNDDCFIVRRIVPLEAERLQGFPDGYTEWGVVEHTLPESQLLKKYKNAIDRGDVVIKNNKSFHKISDAARYKVLGNSLALPCADFVIRGILDVSCQSEAV